MRWQDRFNLAERYELDALSLDIHDGRRWVPLNVAPYRLGERTLSEETQTLNRISSTSTMFDGEWIFHSTRGNVSETVEVAVTAGTQAEVQLYTAQLIEAFSQLTYNLRLTMDNYQETWRCFPADYSVNRGRINIHNRRAVVTFNVPRLPDVSREVIM